MSRSEALQSSEMPDIDQEDPILEAWRMLDKRCESWTEIQAYANLAQVSLFPEEWVIVKEMAGKFIEGLNDSNALSIDPEDRAQ